MAVQWQVLIAAMVPSLKRQIEDDDAQCVERTHRLRVGLYSFDTAPLPGRTTRYACASAT